MLMKFFFKCQRSLFVMSDGSKKALNLRKWQDKQTKRLAPIMLLLPPLITAETGSQFNGLTHPGHHVVLTFI